MIEKLGLGQPQSSQRRRPRLRDGEWLTWGHTARDFTLHPSGMPHAHCWIPSLGLTARWLRAWTPILPPSSTISVTPGLASLICKMGITVSSPSKLLYGICFFSKFTPPAPPHPPLECQLHEDRGFVLLFSFVSLVPRTVAGTWWALSNISCWMSEFTASQGSLGI